MKTRLVSVLASMTLAAAALSMAGPAHADPVPVEQQFYVPDQGLMANRSSNSIDGAYIVFGAPGGAFPAGTSVEMAFSSCGQVVQSRTYALADNDGDGDAALLHYFTESGQPSMETNSINGRLGKKVEWSATVVQPGYDPYVLSFSLTADIPRPACDVILNGPAPTPTAITVQSWSTKKGAKTAQVGKRLAVTATRASGAKVAYAWKVGPKVVDTDRSLIVKKTYRGKKVTLRITASKSGAKSVSKTLRFGAARG